MHISRLRDQSYVTQPLSSDKTRLITVIYLSFAPPPSRKHVVGVQNKSVNNKYPHCLCEVVLKHVAQQKIGMLSIPIRFVCMCHTCVPEVVKTIEGH